MSIEDLAHFGFSKPVKESSKEFYDEPEFVIGYISNAIQTLEFLGRNAEDDLDEAYGYAIQALMYLQGQVCK